MYSFQMIIFLLNFLHFALCLVLTDILKIQICMDELGCFDAGPPFYDPVHRPISLLPEDRKSIDTHFNFYATHSESPSSVFRNFDSSLDGFSSSEFNKHKETIFIIHGFINKIAGHWQKPMVNHFLDKNFNVFFVNWEGGDGSRIPIVEQAVANTRVVGAEIAQFIKTIVEKSTISMNSISLIGHSLGAHVAGLAGKKFPNNKVKRITGLDPAGPFFTSVDPVVRLDKSDANFVDAIHTDAAQILFHGLGLVESIAHFDFWLNGGHHQPGCPDKDFDIEEFLTNLTFNNDGGLNGLICNHVRVIHVFMSTMESKCKLIGEVCNSYQDFNDGTCQNENHGNPKRITLGLEADQFLRYKDNNKSINIYLNTTSKAPYCVS